MTPAYENGCLLPAKCLNRDITLCCSFVLFCVCMRVYTIQFTD